MSDRELFAPVSQLQLPAHCGPCSLSACLFVLGTTATQRQLAKASGRPMRVFAHGIDEQGLRRAAGTYGVVSEFLLAEERRQGRTFATRLRRHLTAGNPAIMLVGHFEHWVAVIGYLKRRHRFIIVDPKDKSSVFRLWSEQTLIRRGWNVNAAPATGEPDQFFAILLARADGGPPRWQVSEAWLRLCERGSDATAEGMANDLAEVARLASPGDHAITDGPYLAELIEEYGEDAPASDFATTSASELLSELIEAILERSEEDETVVLGDVRDAVDQGLLAELEGEGLIESDDVQALVAELDALIERYGVDLPAEDLLRMD